MVDGRIQSLVNETVKELDEIMNVTPGQVAKDVVKKAMGRSVRTKDPMFWPAGMLMLGLVNVMIYLPEGDELQDKAYKSLAEHIKLWKSKYGGKLDYIDDALAGYGVIRLYEKSHLQEHRDVIDQINAYVMAAETDYAGSIIYSPGHGNNMIFADGIGQATMFMAAYIRMKMIVQDLLYNGQESSVHYYSESDYLNEIGKLYQQFFNFYRYGRDKKSGLIYHGYNLVKRSDLDYDSEKNNASRIVKEYAAEHECQKQGLLGWGRAYGWLLMGLSESAGLEMYLIEKGKRVAEKYDFSLIPWYVELCHLAMEYQREDGGWSWQIQAVEGHIDMSATGMIGYALAKGLNDGIFDRDIEMRERIKKSLKRATECMYEHSNDGVVTDSLSSCDDFGVHYQTYGNYPWGQGAVLAAIARAELAEIRT